MNFKKICWSCGQELRSEASFCTRCGKRVLPGSVEISDKESLNLRVLYIMVSLLILAALFPPWETPQADPPEYLGFHFIFSTPKPGAIISRMLQFIELTTIAVAGIYAAWFFRKRPPQ